MKTGQENNPVSIEEFIVSGSSGDVSVIDRKQVNKHVKIYPNPSSDVVNIDMNTNGNKIISLFRADGKMIWQQEIIQNNIQLLKGKDIDNGLYIVTIIGENLGFCSRKIVVK